MAMLSVWAPAAGLLAGSLVLSAAAATRPVDPHRVAAIFPPWWSEGAALGAAAQAGDVVAGGKLPFVVAVVAAEGDLAARLRQAGALFVVDRTTFGLCAPERPQDVQ
jgi:hypothetical protein